MYRITATYHKDPRVHFPEIIKYYTNNRNQFNRERNPLSLIESIERNSVIAVLDNKNDIHAVSLTLHFHYDLHIEFGATRVTLNGFGLQPIMYYLQYLYAYYYDKPRGRIFAITDNENLGSAKNIGRSFFRPLVPDENFLKEISYQKASSSKLFYEIPEDRYDAIAACAALKLRTIHDLGYIEKNGSKIPIIVDDPMFTTPHVRRYLVDELIEKFLPDDCSCLEYSPHNAASDQNERS